MEMELRNRRWQMSLEDMEFLAVFYLDALINIKKLLNFLDLKNRIHHIIFHKNNDEKILFCFDLTFLEYIWIWQYLRFSSSTNEILES